MKFVSDNASYYPKLVRMLYANLEVMTSEVFAFIMDKQMILDVETMA